MKLLRWFIRRTLVSYKIIMKQIIEKINKSWHSNPPCDQQIMLSVGKLFPLPDDYKEFMLWSNGGEGNIGSQYLSLWKIEDLMQLNKEYQIQSICRKNLWLLALMEAIIVSVFILENLLLFFTTIRRFRLI